MSILQKLLSSGAAYEEDSKKFVFRNPQYFQRKLIIFKSKNHLEKIQFSRIPKDFCKKWEIKNKKLVKELSDSDQDLLLQEFMKIEEKKAPEGAPTFKSMVNRYHSLINKLCYKFDKKGSYDLNFDDLWSYALLKLYDCWIQFGNKPDPEFKKIFTRSLANKFQTLISKHYKTQKRGNAEKNNVQIEDYLNVIPDYTTPSSLIEDKENFLELISQFQPIEQYVINEILNPSESTQLEYRVDFLRFKRIKNQGCTGVSRPVVSFKKLSERSQYSQKELQSSLKSVLSKLNLPANLFKR